MYTIYYLYLCYELEEHYICIFNLKTCKYYVILIIVNVQLLLYFIFNTFHVIES